MIIEFAVGYLITCSHSEHVDSNGTNNYDDYSWLTLFERLLSFWLSTQFKNLSKIYDDVNKKII